MLNRKEKAKAIGRFVCKRVLEIQNQCTRNGGTAQGRARVAMLRRGLGQRSSTWMDIGEDMFSDWPQELGAPDNDIEAVRAVQAALHLYAVHQQSKDYGVAQLPDDQGEWATFGRSCRLICPKLEDANGVKRRLNSVQAATDFDGAVRGMRALITLMRSAKSKAGDSRIRLNYYSLAQDLYLMQFNEFRDEIFQRWASDYFRKIPDEK